MSATEWGLLADHFANRAREYRRRRDEASARLMDAKEAECRAKAQGAQS